MLRTTILGFACSIGVQDCLDEAGKEFDKWLQNPSVRPKPDLRNTIYYYGMFTVGTIEKWEQVWQLYLDEGDAQEKSKLMQSLVAIQSPWILKRFIDLAWDESNVRGQDYFSCLQSIAGNPIGESIVWDYVRENWPRLVARFGLNERYLGRMIPSIVGRFSTQTKLDEVWQYISFYSKTNR